MSSIPITLLVFFCHCRLAMALTLAISGSSTLAVGDTLVCTWTATSTDPATFLLGACPSPTGPNADTTPLNALGGPIEIDRNGETTGTKTIVVLNTAGSYILGAALANGQPVTLQTLLKVVPFQVIPKLASRPTSSSIGLGVSSQPSRTAGLSVGDPRSQSTMTSSDGAKAPTVASSSSDGTTVSSSSESTAPLSQASILASSSTDTISQPTSSTNNEKTNARNYGLIFGGSLGTLVLLGAT
ncbi:hypothetical protein C8J56DRAFT_1046099 [Mycena floridula]|nr:hypothetical protein C8J56DRAFT_1046099 [Mycena floridula]